MGKSMLKYLTLAISVIVTQGMAHASTAGTSGSSSRSSEEIKALKCAQKIQPLWEEFQSFKNDALFNQVGFGIGHPYSSWNKRVLNFHDQEAGMQGDCGRLALRESPGFPEMLTTTPIPHDLIYASRGFYGGPTDASLEIAEQKYLEISAFLEWARSIGE